MILSTITIYLSIRKKKGGSKLAKRVQSCIGFDTDNLKWLHDRPEGMAEFLNRLVRAYRDKKTVQTAVGNDVINPAAELELKTTVASVKEDIVRMMEEDEVKIHAYLLDNPHIMYMALTQRKFVKKDLCKIKDELYFSKYNVDATLDQVKKALKEEMEKFDVEDYKTKRGIVEEVR